MADSRHVSLDEVVLHFAELEDPRSNVNRQHPLVSGDGNRDAVSIDIDPAFGYPWE